MGRAFPLGGICYRPGADVPSNRRSREVARRVRGNCYSGIPSRRLGFCDAPNGPPEQLGTDCLSGHVLVGDGDRHTSLAADLGAVSGASRAGSIRYTSVCASTQCSVLIEHSQREAVVQACTAAGR